jgi:putative hydrolase of the HAD superfamily
MSIRAVFFDMGGTIETFNYSTELRLKATPELNRRLQSAGIDLHLRDEQLCSQVVAGWDRYHTWSIQTMEELPPERVWSEYILPGFRVDEEKLASIAQELMFYFELQLFHRELRPETPAVLDAVKNMGFKIGLISNVCSRDLVPTSLKRYGIDHCFDPIILSSSYGRRKPDPAIFHYAARLANVPTSECLYIGDRIARDIVGARRAGFALAIQIINPFDHGEEDKGAVPDAIIHQMTELIDILKTENNKSKLSTRPVNLPHDRVRALLFDAGDILYHRPNRGRYFSAFLTDLGLAEKEIPEASKQELKDKAFHGLISQSQYRQAILHLYGITDPELVERGSRAMGKDDNDIQFFKGVRETLKHLKEQGYLLGIITDTANPIHVKLAWFERGGFGHVWDSIISSQEFGFEKPDPRIYAAALQQLGLSANQAVFVGHCPEELNGASVVGMKTIALNYEATAMADFYIEKFSDLLTVPVISQNNNHK